MKPIFIIGSGHRESSSFYLPFFQQSAILVSIDGGSDLYKELNILPDWVIGDFDSISEDTDKWLKKNSIVRYSYKPLKDFSDFELASQKIIQEYTPTQIDLFCMQGERSDHFLLNLIICENLLDKGFNSIFHSKKEIIYLIDRNHPLTGKGNTKDLISIIPCKNMVMIQYTKGLKYELKCEKLRRYSSRGLSNEIIEEFFEVSILDGQAIVIQTRKSL